MKLIKPTASYQLALPENISTQVDGRVSSFWVVGEPLLLQTSSYIRQGGPQTSAAQRLSDRIKKDDANWQIWKEVLLEDSSVDQAVGEYIDEDGLRWIHAYFVWPHLTVYTTASGPPEKILDQDSWVLRTLRSVSLNRQ
jgi:hypothetical protein